MSQIEKPLYILNNHLILLNTNSRFHTQASYFLNIVAEPLSRPENIHEYRINSYSLFAAIAVGLTSEEIIQTLTKFSCTGLPKVLENYISETTRHYGKAKLFFQKGRYFLQSTDMDFFNEMLLTEQVWNCRLSSGLKKMILNTKEDIPHDKILLNRQSSCQTFFIKTKENKIIKIFSMEIDKTKIESLRHFSVTFGYPLQEEYNYLEDKTLQDFKDLKLIDSSVLRPYQQSSLSRIFSGGRASSGIFVLPCGAGKSLLGIAAACTIGKSTVVVATTGVSCTQWKQQFLKWTHLKVNQIVCFTSNEKENITERKEPFVLITTYYMLSIERKKSEMGEKIMKFIEHSDWGLILLDEVHIAPANMFRKVLSKAHAKTRIGLTATLLREDTKTEDLYFLVGPKLYEANWLQLQQEGYLAKVKCIEIWCPFETRFKQEYENSSHNEAMGKRAALSTLNPTKFEMVKLLIEKHEQEGHSIMIFSDNVVALKIYSEFLRRPLIYGKTVEKERIKILNKLRSSKGTVFVSKVGDTSIDLPDVNVIIQISFHFSSRRQETQRLGRVLRPKTGNSNLDVLNIFKNKKEKDFNAVFYSLVTTKSDEEKYTHKRQSYLVDQGYSFYLIDDLSYIENNENKKLEVEQATINNLIDRIKQEKIKSYFEENELEEHIYISNY